MSDKRFVRLYFEDRTSKIDVATVLCDDLAMAQAYVDYVLDNPGNTIDAFVSGITFDDMLSTVPNFSDYVPIQDYAPKFCDKYWWQSRGKRLREQHKWITESRPFSNRDSELVHPFVD